MQTSLLHQLIIGTPIIYDQFQKQDSRFLLDSASLQSQYPSSEHQSKCRVSSNQKKRSRKADSNSEITTRLGTNISETIKRKLSLGARILQVGGVEKVFMKYFSVIEGERLLKVCHCYLSTTSGPLAGLLFISTEKVAFCSERSIKVFNQKGQMCRIHYKNMSRKFSPIKDLNDSKETWRLAVRVVDFWSVINSKGKEHLEMVLMDVSGDRIQVLIRSDHTPKWKARIRENMSCIINNGTVYENDFQWKLCDHDKKFVFIGGTTVKEVEIQNLPPKRFFFKDFNDILGGNCEMNRLEDIIGVVQEINNFQYNNSGKKSFVSLSLKDLKGVIVNCTLWESYGTKFLDFYHDEKNSGAIVIILTHAMIKESQVSNGWSGSKLLINEDIPEITEYLSKLPSNEQTEKPSQSSKGMSLWSGASQFTPVESFVHKAKCISLSELCKVKQDMLCVTVGTTQRFFVSKHGWFYYGCTKCSLKASDVNNPYKCSCGQNVEHAIPRYRVDIYVVDGDSKFRFVFWDSDCADIIGKSADSIYKAMLEEGDDDPMIYPDDLDMLLGKKMAFRAKVQPTFGQASVWKLSYDEEFVKEIEKDYITDEGDSKSLNQNPVVDRVDESIESLSAYGENDPDKQVTNTPSKGSPVYLDAEDSELQAYGTTQLSGTKPAKKVKIESDA